MNRKAVILASGLAVLAPASVLAVSRSRGGESSGCTVRYSSTAGQLRLALTLEQAGSVEVRAGSDTRHDEPAGSSVVTLPGADAPSVTEFTGDGQQLACIVTPGG